VPWHYLKNVRNRSLKKSARYPDEAKGDTDLPNRTELEKLSEKFDAKYLVAVMNSKVARGYLMEHRRSNIHLFPDDWKPLPVPVATPEQQAPIIATVSLLTAILSFFKSEPDGRTARDELLISFLDALCDALVSELYYPERFKAKGLYVAKLVTQARLPNPKRISELREMESIRKSLEDAYDINQPLRAVLYDFGSLELATEAEASK